MESSTQMRQEKWLEMGRKIYQERKEEPMVRRRYKEFTNVHVGNPLGWDSRDDRLWGYYEGRWFKLNAFPQVVPDGFAITPFHIGQTSGCGMFGRSGIEYNAVELVRFAQRQGNWNDFTAEKVGIESYGLDWLAEMGFLLKKEDGYAYTIGFVLEFYTDSPKK